MAKKDNLAERVNTLVDCLEDASRYEELDEMIHTLTAEIRTAIETLEHTQEWLLHLAMAAQKRNLERLKKQMGGQ